MLALVSAWTKRKCEKERKKKNIRQVQRVRRKQSFKYHAFNLGNWWLQRLLTIIDYFVGISQRIKVTLLSIMIKSLISSHPTLHLCFLFHSFHHHHHHQHPVTKSFSLFDITLSPPFVYLPLSLCFFVFIFYHPLSFVYISLCILIFHFLKHPLILSLFFLFFDSSFLKFFFFFFFFRVLLYHHSMIISKFPDSEKS